MVCTKLAIFNDLATTYIRRTLYTYHRLHSTFWLEVKLYSTFRIAVHFYNSLYVDNKFAVDAKESVRIKYVFKLLKSLCAAYLPFGNQNR